MAEELSGKRVAFLFAEGVEEVELTRPLRALREAGAEVEKISLDSGPKGFRPRLVNRI